MNRPLLSRIAPFLLAFYAVSLGAFFAYALAGFSATLYLPGFRMEYALKRAFILFMQYLIPVHAAAIAVAVSLSDPGGRTPARPGTPGQAFSRIVSSTLVAFLVLTAGYTALSEGVETGSRRRLADMRYLSSLARQYKSAADAAEKAGDYRTARDAVDRYLAIDKGNKAMAERLVDLGARAQGQAAPASATESSVDAASSAQALMDKAKDSKNKGDWFSARYYAAQAALRDPRRQDAQRLAAEVDAVMSGRAAASNDAAAAELYRQKKDALALLESGNFLAAYYSFSDLARANRNDTDITRYLAEAERGMSSLTFFLDDARKLETLPGTQQILFLNRVTAEAREAVFIGKMVDQGNGTAWFYDIEALRWDAKGAVLWHFSAPYGVLVGDQTILLHGVDRTDSRLQKLPVYIAGSRPEPVRNILSITPSVEELHALSASSSSLTAMNILDLWRLRSGLAASGIPRPALTVAMAMRMVMPFVFLAVSLFCVSLGWAFRYRPLQGRLTVAAFVLLPVVPVVLAVLSLLYVHAHRVVAGFTVLAFGLRTALIILAAVELLLFAAALALLAGQRGK